MNNNGYNIILAGGGTGGHLYPAIAVAEEIMNLSPNTNILFIGTKDKIEARVIPELGYKIKKIWISGFTRKLNFKNLLFPLKVLISLLQSFIISIRFKPNVVIGAGAYVSGPIVWVSSLLGAKVVLLEQNSFPGVTNRLLQKQADRIHISFKDSEKYFNNKDKIRLTGNPVRTTLQKQDKSEAIRAFSLDKDKKVLLVIGGSLGAKTLNQAIAHKIELLTKKDIQIIWQTGEHYFNEYSSLMNDKVKIYQFITNMSEAYSCCDLLLARAGATTIAEVAYLGIPTIFVPSVNVAANHQYKNAKSLVEDDAGIMIEDKDLMNELDQIVFETITNSDLLNKLSRNIKKYSKPNAANDIALDVLKLVKT